VETGVRRCGKSFIARQVSKLFIDAGYGKEDILIINLEDEKLIERNYALLLDAYAVYKREIRPKRKPLIIIDEAQEVDGWERFVRGISERNDASFIITGSSSALLSSEYSTLLSGRHITTNIMPLSFLEFARFNGLEIGAVADISKNSDELRRLLNQYLRYGGMPAVVLSKNKEELLLSYFDTILIKDVANRYRIRNQDRLRFLAKFYLTNVSSQITFNSISNSTKEGKTKGMPVKTVQRFSEYLASSYLFFFVKRFSFSVKEQENSPRKVYSIDNGFVGVIGFNFTEIRGRLLENLVACELLRKTNMGRNTELHYWKSAASEREVDFILKEGKKISAIQVAYDVSAINAKEREVGGLTECAKELGIKNGLVVTHDYKSIETVNGIMIEYMPIYEWVLKQEFQKQTTVGK
jgi:predicted AAA+ superfamily ATPase